MIHAKNIEPLSFSETQQTLVIARLQTQSLNALYGLLSSSGSLEKSVLLIEQFSHSPSDLSSIQGLAEIGGTRFAQDLEQMRPIICKEWDYCKRRATGGFGDIRSFTNDLFLLLLNNYSLVSEFRSRETMLTLAVLLARTDLSRVCNCNSH
jgi:hypothetical protein